MGDLRRAFVDEIRHSGVPLGPHLAAAFARVPREAFVPDGFRGPDERWVRPGDDDFRPLVYRDDVLVTKLSGNRPVSSSSQPSLMARMIDALDVRPGQRVLEIGTGTGYNAALLSTLGAIVTSIDVQPDVAGRARRALTRAGIGGVRVEPADGYAGVPGAVFDRIIVTAGIAGLSARWPGQLAPGGVIVAPVDHAGMHPVLAVRATGTGALAAILVCHAGFISAAGPLTADHPGAFPPPGELGDLAAYAPAAFPAPLDPLSYRNLWYAAGVWNRRASHTSLPGAPEALLALIDEPGTGGAVVLPDGGVRAGGASADRYGAEAVAVVDRWRSAHMPAAGDWRVGFTLTGDADSPIWVPASWHLLPPPGSGE